MKKRDVEEYFKKNGWVVVKKGVSLETWTNKRGITEHIPLKEEISERLSEYLKKRAESKPGYF